MSCGIPHPTSHPAGAPSPILHAAARRPHPWPPLALALHTSLPLLPFPSAQAAAGYVRLLIPALYCCGLSECLKRYLLAQGLAKPATAATAVALALAPLANWLLIFRLGLGLRGAALATNAVQLFMAGALGGYVAARDARRAAAPDATWAGWSWQAFRGWGLYFAFALPSVAMICCEWW